MRICCDENVSGTILTVIAEEGHDVTRVQDDCGLGTDDALVVDWCRETDRILLTSDDDFFGFDTHPGILYLDEQGTRPRPIVTAIQRIDRHVPRLDDTVWHVPDGWV